MQEWIKQLYETIYSSDSYHWKTWHLLNELCPGLTALILIDAMEHLSLKDIFSKKLFSFI